MVPKPCGAQFESLEGREGRAESRPPMPASAHVSWMAGSLGWLQGLHPSGVYPGSAMLTTVLQCLDKAQRLTAGAQYMFVI